uniref:Uncharacterized protein n=1 Tax=Opuntia streptacantha TaxID=393608 RepID=A0A7C8Z9T3_OPUST
MLYKHIPIFLQFFRPVRRALALGRSCQRGGTKIESWRWRHGMTLLTCTQANRNGKTLKYAFPSQRLSVLIPLLVAILGLKGKTKKLNSHSGKHWTLIQTMSQA